MSTLPDRPNTALVVIDVQQGVVGEAPGRDEVVGNISALVEKARGDDLPVVWVQHSDEELVQGSDAWKYVPELVRRQSEPLVHKSYGDSFEGTDLEEVLSDLAVGRLVVAGAESDACIRSTIHGAFTRGYDVTLAIGDLDRPTPCADWDVRSVVAHLADVADALAGLLATGRLTMPESPARPVDDPVTGAQRRVQQLLDQLHAAGEQGSRGHPAPWVTEAAHGAAIELTVHGWDVAAARAGHSSCRRTSLRTC